jgi:metal-sulfur cluster biosynthetic enzyme
MTSAQGFFTRISIMLTEAEVYEALRGCYDREIPVNIVDLGLVYGVTLEGGVVDVRMKLTVPGCSMGRMWSTTRS